MNYKHLVLLVSLFVQPTTATPSQNATTTRILFGSCNKVELEQTLWNPIVARKPSAWIWAGDAVYGDTLQWRLLPFPRPTWKPATIKKLEALYKKQKAHPGYQALLKTGVPVLGTWDDHDFGVNDADHTPDDDEATKKEE